jgi:hypothetical protein
VAAKSPDALVTLPYAKPSSQFPLGGDYLGRDVLSRVLHGGWVLLLMAVAATVLGVAVGAAGGMSAAYLRGKSDGFIMRTVPATGLRAAAGQHPRPEAVADRPRGRAVPRTRRRPGHQVRHPGHLRT